MSDRSKLREASCSRVSAGAESLELFSSLFTAPLCLKSVCESCRGTDSTVRGHSAHRGRTRPALCAPVHLPELDSDPGACACNGNVSRNGLWSSLPLKECDNLWWDAFATEFFEDDAVLTVVCCLEDGSKRYTIGRTLIPRYFRSIFDGGATDLYFTLKHSKESLHSNLVILDCDLCSMVTLHSQPVFTKVCTEGRLYLEFTFDDLMRIKHWHFNIKQSRELLSRDNLPTHDPPMLEQLSNSITRSGLSNFTLNYLRLCVILEPMQELMVRHKSYKLSPRDCLKTCLFQKWQQMVAPPGERLGILG
ncbi:LIM domain-binding protein 1-like [Chiloscyllium plagiosum]|uniref:LIM domain-binding protein 1-like n=1 Tax=Chiloscyllium plagiosum TaxID=36176 RepID=UPI001CB87F56|nr:LIM domain-binding protein 1-like [Chiloscyllium plagiosum]